MNQSTPAIETPAPLRHETAYRLEVSSYDRASGLLISLLVMVGFFVVGIVIVYFATRVFPHFEPVPVEFVEISGREPDAAMGLSRDLEPPGIEDAPDLQEPQLMETLSAVSEISSRVARLDNEAFDGENLATKGKGAGDSRRAGTGGEGIDGVPAEQRWKIRYDGSSINTYARQLDGFGIELGAFSGGDDVVHYASNLAANQPTIRTGLPKGEKRLYMYRSGGDLDSLNQTLLQKAGIDMSGKVSAQFYPRQIEGRLLQLERGYMEKETGQYDIGRIRKTIFGINREGDGYVFYVIDQRRR